MKTTVFSQNRMAWLPTLLLGLFLGNMSLGLQSCASAKFDQKALDNVTMLAQKLPALMEKATKPYKDSESEATVLLKSISDAQAYAAGIKKNKEIAEQWRILRDDLVQPYLNRWKEKGKLDKDFVAPAVKQVKDALASIERAEKAKKK